MKIKIKDFKGIYTNIDENDNRLELVRDSENFYHRRGYLEIDPRNLAEESNLPDPNNDFPLWDWTFETGIYTTLSGDLLSTRTVPVPSKHDVLVLIAKTSETVSGELNYYRLVYLYDITNSEGWYEMSANGNGGIVISGKSTIDLINHQSGLFNYGFIHTTIDGKTHFQVEDGRLKIYMPHDTFWLGKIDRKLYVEDGSRRWPVTVNGETTYPYIDYEHDYWYLDRVVDEWKHTRQTINYDGVNIAQADLTGSHDITLMRCAKYDSSNFDKRRLGIVFDVVPNTDTSHIVDAREVKMGDPHGYQIRAEDSLANIRCLRHQIWDGDTGLPVNNPSLPYPVYPNIWLWKVDAARTTGVGPGDWTFTAADYPNIYIHVHPSLVDVFRLASGAAWSTLSSYEAKTDNIGTVWRASVAGTYPASSAFSISLEDFYNNTIEYGGDLEVGDIGWETGENKFSIVVTGVLDEREEIPMYAHNFAVEVAAKYIIDIKNIRLPWDFNKRLTRIRFYHKLKDGADYEMVKDFDLLTAEDTIKDFGFSAEDYEGTTLAQNIGFLWDYYEHPSDLQLVQGFKDFVTESGVSIGIANRDEVAIYYSTFGGGNLMPDLIYDDNRLPITGVAKLTAVANADGRLMAFTPNTSYVINAEEISGVLAFKIEDTVELGVKDKNDVANIQGGVVAHTQHGIYITNGYETQLISEPIDDIIIANYSTGRIFYNRYKHEVYYKPTASEDLYRFRLKDSVWERMDKTVSTSYVEQEYEEEALD